ncbi:MAG: hypothetical protein QOE59_4661 [Actinomycetota bacterium]|nr:hypothetical protein [Actinomycetota bacterium]
MFFLGTHRRHVDLVRTASAACPGCPVPIVPIGVLH